MLSVKNIMYMYKTISSYMPKLSSYWNNNFPVVINNLPATLGSKVLRNSSIALRNICTTDATLTDEARKFIIELPAATCKAIAETIAETVVTDPTGKVVFNLLIEHSGEIVQMAFNRDAIGLAKLVTKDVLYVAISASITTVSANPVVTNIAIVTANKIVEQSVNLGLELYRIGWQNAYNNYKRSDEYNPEFLGMLDINKKPMTTVEVEDGFIDLRFEI